MGDSGVAGALPQGTVTFLFTDLEGSTRLLEAHPAAYREAVRRHHALLRQAVEAHGGAVFETVGDAVYAAFAAPTDAVAAAIAGQLALQREDWGEVGAGALRARMGLHTGEVELQGAHYFGAALYRCARLTATAHGGQVVLSAAAAEVVRDALPAAASLRDLGAHRLKDLQAPERVAQLTHPGLPAAFPPLRSLDALPNNLPRQLTSFVGRERELAAVARLLASAPLLTLTGPGGTGKTRLALQAAADALEAYPDGVWLVELAGLADPTLVPSAIARTLEIREAVGRPVAETLREHLRDKRLLLVLDNCEHLLPGAASAVAALLGAGPGLTVLATSREPLRLAGEHQLAVPPLGLPDAVDPIRPPAPEALSGCEAVALFVARATAVVPDFAVTVEDAPAVAELCRRLDGLPLALELAAARVKVLPPRALLARLDRRLAVLTGGRRDAPVRQQTVRAALDWSHALLPPQEQALFARLAVFAGGCTLEAAGAVGGAGDGDPAEVLDGLGSLVDKSLLRPEGSTGGEPRFAMLETIREYALERLERSGEADEAHRAHAAYFLDLAERAAQAPVGEGEASWQERLERERDNLRAALRRAARGARGRDPEAAEQGLRLAVALAHFWFARGPVAEGREWLTTLLASSEHLADAALRADALVAESELSSAQDDLVAARRRCAEALAIYRRLGDRHGATRALFNLAQLARVCGDLPAAGALLEECLGLGRGLGDADRIAAALTHLGIVARLQRRYAEARTLLAEGLAIRRGADDRWSVAGSLCQLGLLACAAGDAARARAFLHEATALRHDLLDRRGLTESLDAHAALAAARAAPARALRLAGAASALREAIGWSPWPSVQRQTAEWLRPARRALDEATAAAAWAAGRAMPLEQAVAYALEDEDAPAPT